MEQRAQARSQGEGRLFWAGRRTARQLSAKTFWYVTPS